VAYFLIGPFCIRVTFLGRRNYTEELQPLPLLRMRSSAPKFYAVPHNKVAEVGDIVRFQCAVAGMQISLFEFFQIKCDLFFSSG